MPFLHSNPIKAQVPTDTFFQGPLFSFLTKTHNAISGDIAFSTRALEAHIMVLPKPGKDSSLCGSYCPISLTNIDNRLYSKIIANRLTSIFSDLIHLHQVGFIPGKPVKTPWKLSICLIKYAKERNLQPCLVSVVAKKVFVPVQWDCLQATLHQIGLVPNICQKMMAL